MSHKTLQNYFFCLLFAPFLLSCSSNNQSGNDTYPGTKYFIDAKNGHDTNPGTALDQAWQTLNKINNTLFQPGDQILFRADGKWSGQLWPKGSGTDGSPVIIDMYGDGNKPLIAAEGEFRDAVKLSNQKYWEIRNLEITNYREGDDQFDPINLKRGVYVLAKDTGEINHIHLINLHIHDVNGLLEPNFPAKNNGGIYFEVLGNSKKSWFNDFLIEGCYVHDIDRTGISNKSSWWSRTIDDNQDWVPSLNIVIRNTIVERAAYNAIILRCADGALVEHCILRQNGIKGNGNALFIFHTDNSLIQYNEAYGTVYQEGTSDAAGFDSDGYNHKSIFQYNYSHDNELGGLVMAVGDGPAPFNDGTIFRYNICQNNKREGIRLSGYPTNARFYNNVFYIDSSESSVNIIHHKKWGGWPSKISYYNNIFYNMSSNSYYSFGQSSEISFSHNTFFGIHGAGEPDDPYKMTSDPRLVNPGSGSLGIENVEGYMLIQGSPCIDNGLLLDDHGDADYWGNAIPYNDRPDRGVHEVKPEKSN